MLLHWFNNCLNFAQMRELRIYIQPHKIVCSLVTRSFKTGFKWQLQHREVIAVDATNHLNEKLNGNSQTHFLINTLETVLQSATWQHLAIKNLAAKIVLSQHFVHYLAMPWREDISNNAEQQAYLKHHFSRAFGEHAADWHLSSSQAAFGQAALASGVSHDLLSALKAQCQQAGMRLMGVYPQLSMVMNHVFSELNLSQSTAPFWLVAFESGRACLILIAQGEVRTVKNVLLESDPLQHINTLIMRETILHQLREPIAPDLAIVMVNPPFTAQSIAHIQPPIQLIYTVKNHKKMQDSAFFGFEHSQNEMQTSAVKTRLATQTLTAAVVDLNQEDKRVAA